MNENGISRRDALKLVGIGALCSIFPSSVLGKSLPEFPAPKKSPRITNRNVIFFHPDGFGLAHWDALRTYVSGPNGKLNWDNLPHMAVYTGNMKDSLTGTSHGGATTHAYGVKVVADSFGLDGHEEITALSGKNMSIMEEAIRAGFATGLVQSGDLTEPGTAAFVSSVKERDMYGEIAKQVIESKVDVILGGGEGWLLPKGVAGRHGAGARADGLNLIERARALGYTVVHNRDELMKLDAATRRVLGVFAHRHTFNDLPEEELRARGLPLYVAGSPTVTEMSEAALRILSQNPKSTRQGTFLVVEEEGTDNLPNNSNAMGAFEAGRRADETIGVFIDFVSKNPNTLLLLAADSNAGGMNFGHVPGATVGSIPVNTGKDGKFISIPADGVAGADTAPFIAASDKAGNRLPFRVAWATRKDMAGGVLARAKGLNAELVSEMRVVDNTDIYRLMYYTLFNVWLT